VTVEVEADTKLKAFRTDRGGEFRSNEFISYCKQVGLKRYLTAPYSPQQNGVVERRNQTVTAMARSMMRSMNMPAKFWGEAVTTTVYILNRAPTKSVLRMTLYEAWHKQKPRVHHMRTFGCTTHVKKVDNHMHSTFDYVEYYYYIIIYYYINIMIIIYYYYIIFISLL
jgi:transposase InsO family protein